MASVQELKNELQTLIDRATDLADGTQNIPEKDAIQIAAELGRLDLISLLLAVLGILIGIFGVVGFFEIRAKAARIAREEARESAVDVAQAAAYDHVDTFLPSLVEDAVAFFMEQSVTEDSADEIAANFGQEDEPSIEEILANIRQVISDDDEPGADG